MSLTTIENCFKMARFFKYKGNDDDCDSGNETVIYDFNSDRDFNDVSGLLQLTASHFSEYVNCYENEQTENEPSDSQNVVTSENIGNTDDESDDEIVGPPPSLSDVNKSLCIVHQYFEAHGGDYNLIYSLEKEVEKISVRSMKKQTKDYFL